MASNQQTKSNKIFYLILGLVLVLSLVFLIVPVAAVLISGLQDVPAAAESKEVQFSLLLSIKTATEATIFCMIFSSLAGYAIHQLKPVLQKIIFSIISIPMSLPHLVSGVALLLVYGQLGIGGWLLKHFGIDFVYTKQGIILALIFVNLSYSIIMMYSSFDSRQDRLEFTARTLGCSKIQAFFSITIPIILPTFLSTAVMTWSRALGEFGAVIMIAGSTRLKTEILPTTVYLSMATGDLNIALGVSVILMLVSIICIILLQMLIPGSSKKDSPVCSI